LGGLENIPCQIFDITRLEKGKNGKRDEGGMKKEGHAEFGIPERFK